MIEFLLKVWGLTRPYRGRLLLGVLTGIVGGLIEPLMIATVTFIYGLIFPSVNAPPLADKLRLLPEAVREWVVAAQQALSSGATGHPWAVLALVGAIPGIMLLRGLFPG